MDMKTTYAETKGNTVTDWNFVLNNWETFTRRTKGLYVKQSKSWITCACGNLCDKIPRYSDAGAMHNAAPTDLRLYSLGNIFCENLKNGDIAHAKLTLARIEERSIEILATL